MFLQILIPIFFGTYGNNIYTADFDTETRTFSNIVATPAHDASFIIKDEDGYFAVSENKDNPGAYTFSPDFKETSHIFSGIGEYPCNIYRDKKHNLVYTANYGSGTISVLKLNRHNRIKKVAATLEFEGSGPKVDQQSHPRIHQVFALNDDWLLANDLGADCIRILKVNPRTGMPSHISDFNLPAGCGPRIMTFNSDHSIIYLVTELSREVYVIRPDLSGDVPSLELVQRVKCDDYDDARGGADVCVHPSGKWLYASMRLEHEGIARFEIKSDGTLEYLDYTLTGSHPRNFSITPDGRTLLAACVFSEFVQVFAINDEGELIPANTQLKLGEERPTCVQTGYQK